MLPYQRRSRDVSTVLLTVQRAASSWSPTWRLCETFILSVLDLNCQCEVFQLLLKSHRLALGLSCILGKCWILATFCSVYPWIDVIQDFFFSSVCSRSVLVSVLTNNSLLRNRINRKCRFYFSVFKNLHVQRLICCVLNLNLEHQACFMSPSLLHSALNQTSSFKNKLRGAKAAQKRLQSSLVFGGVANFLKAANTTLRYQHEKKLQLYVFEGWSGGITWFSDLWIVTSVSQSVWTWTRKEKLFRRLKLKI